MMARDAAVSGYGLWVPRNPQGMNDWFTDRLPTEADGDHDGKVAVLARFNESDDTVEAFAHWSRVKPGTIWRHTFFFRLAEPAPEPEPEANAPDPAPEPEAATPEPTPQTRKVPRGFLGFYDMPKNNQGGPERVVVAIATDHTAWFREPDRLGFCWIQVPPLPDREEPIDAA